MNHFTTQKRQGGGGNKLAFSRVAEVTDTPVGDIEDRVEAKVNAQIGAKLREVEQKISERIESL